MQPKPLLTAAFLLISMYACAQFEKKMIMAGSTVATSVVSGGTTDFTAPNATPSTVTNTNINVSITPSLGWFINSNTVVGASLLLNYGNQKQRHSVSGITDRKNNAKSTDFGLGGFLRYYMGKTTMIKPFVHGYLNAGSGSGTTDGVAYTTVEKTTYDGKISEKFFYNAGLNAGITKMFTPAAGLDVFIGYGYSHTKFHQRTDFYTDYTGSGPDTRSVSEYDQKFSGHALNIGIGFQVFISRK